MLGKIKQYIAEKCSGTKVQLGLFVEENKIFLAQGYSGPDGITLLRLAERPLSEAETEHGSVGETVETTWRMEGLQSKILVLCLPESMVHCFLREFPPLPAAELVESVKWEVEETTDSITGEHTYAYRETMRSEEQVVLQIETAPLHPLIKLVDSLSQAGFVVRAAVGRQPLQVKKTEESLLLQGDDWQQAILPGKDLVLEESFSGGQIASLQALAYPGGHQPDLLPRERRPPNINYARGVFLLLAAVAIVLAGLIFHGWNALLAAKEAGETARLRMGMFQEMAEQKTMLELQQLKNGKKVQLLTALSSRRSSSARGILIHLGFLTTDNVKLTEVEFQADGMLRLEGRAADYDALAAYLHRFETDNFFTEVHLAGAESDRDVAGDFLPVRFSLQSSFGGQEVKE